MPTGNGGSHPLEAQLTHWSRVWGVAVETAHHTDSSIVAFGSQHGRSVVLKIVSPESDEASAAAVADAFQGRGVVRVHDHAGGAMLLERLVPGTALAGLVLVGRDDEATELLAEVIDTMEPREVPRDIPTADRWCKSFEAYVVSGDRQIAEPLVADAHEMYARLCRTQTQPRLLHGDLHHYNVLRDDARGWVAIDPKGLVGEPAFELGAVFRNPHERPALFADPARIEARLARFTRRLGVDPDRVLGWAFAQAVLSAIWSIEDRGTIGPDHPSLALAEALRRIGVPRLP